MKLMSDRNPVGLVGIGLLGQAFAHRLLDAGFEVVGFDVDPAKNAKLAELGGRPASSVADLARRCDPIVLAVFSTDQVETVIEGELLPALGDRSGKIVLCASTCDPDRIAALGQRVAMHGLRLLETPVSGASGQVSRGEGVGLIGGDADVMNAVAPVLRALFASYFRGASPTLRPVRLAMVFRVSRRLLGSNCTTRLWCTPLAASNPIVRRRWKTALSGWRADTAVGL